jgi:hypothetical protein
LEEQKYTRKNKITGFMAPLQPSMRIIVKLPKISFPAAYLLLSKQERRAIPWKNY